MEARLAKLEAFAEEVRDRLARIEERLEQTATKADIAEIRADFEKSSADIARWMIATVISLFLGFVGLFFVMNNSAKNISPAPIVIYAQPPHQAAPVTPPQLPNGRPLN